MIDIDKIKKDYENVKITISKKDFLEILAKSCSFVTDIVLMDDEEMDDETKAKLITTMAFVSAHAAKRLFDKSDFDEVAYSEKEVN